MSTGRPPSEPVREPVRDRCTTPDGVEVELYDFGGDGPDLLLVHATGFCAEVFTPLARHLFTRFRCWALDLRVHGRSGRPADGDLSWTGFATDVLAVVDHLGLVTPYGFGHSCGGASVLLAEELAPGTFRSLYCFEPVLFPGGPVVVPGSTPSGSIADNPMSAGALRRRPEFPSAAEALDNFSSKPPFGDFDPDALAGYIEGGFELVPEEAGGDGRAVRLRCRREDEAEVYAQGASHPTFQRLPEIGCPVTLACGAETDSFGPAALELDAVRLRQARVEVFPGVGHFGPLQRPDLVAEAVAGALGSADDTPPS